MEDNIRNLLIRIDQPDFPYRNFDHPDHVPLLEKWPLMALIAQLPELRAAPLGQAKAGASKNPRPATSHVRSVQTENAGRAGLLSNYDSPPSKADPAKDVRSLLGRLSEDLR